MQLYILSNDDLKRKARKRRKLGEEKRKIDMDTFNTFSSHQHF
jgi:hypothetical protein